MSADPRRIILASRSPRRYELLCNLGFLPVVAPADVPEQRDPGESPTDYVLRLAADKALAVAESGVAQQHPGASPWVLAADTVVVQGEHVLEKPNDHQHAVTMLQSLSNSSHHVITGIGLQAVDGDHVEVLAVSSRVTFRPLSTDAILRYVATNEPMDKAGGYGIQGLAGAFVARIDGSYTNIVGLPVQETVSLMLSEGAIPHFPFHDPLSTNP